MHVGFVLHLHVIWFLFVVVVDLTWKRAYIWEEFWNVHLRMTEFDCPEVTLPSWQDVKIQLLSEPQVVVLCLRHTRVHLQWLYCSQLQRSSRDITPNSTRRSSYGSDEIFDDIDGNFQDLNGRVRALEECLDCYYARGGLSVCYYGSGKQHLLLLDLGV